MREVGVVEGRADASHHAVDHAARRDEVGARFRVRDRNTIEHLERLVIQNVTFGEARVRPLLAPGVEHPAVAVVGVLAQADVGDHDQLRHRLLDRAHRLRDDAVRREVLFADRIL